MRDEERRKKAKKFEVTSETKLWNGRTLYRIRALVAFRDVDAGELGGWIEKESNLSQDGNAWVFGNAEVYDNALVFGNARVYGNAWVSGNARVSDNARVYERRSIMWISVIGSRDDTVTFFAQKGGIIGVTVGCFYGSIDEFAEKVRATHGDNEHAKAYMLAIELAKLRIKTKGATNG